MAKRGKKYVDIRKKKPEGELSLAEGVAKVKELSYSSFEGKIELHVAYNVPKDKDAKSIKGSMTLPHSTGDKEVKIAVLTTKDNEKAAAAAGADMSNLEELTKAIKAGKIEFDVAIATPDVMPQIAALGKELGPRGLMPNPKTGTVTDDLKTAIEEYRKGKITFKSDDDGVMHFTVGTVSMDDEKILENVQASLDAASDAIGKKITTIAKSAYLAPTMGPSVKVEIKSEE